ncbi:aminodeoxychorismate synthase, subunit I [Dethiosulfatibacter aminovorans DSM 17477]|uniref:Anthranilate synthase component 1 n=1 Tax=Dethiosulfatibacter aminovorans DSM 17477 TaxID=1121476 RepID=A0A1M6GQ38_9FIRM|nr:aminodeoxychorismate synthase component I [Dethiosulfatibacter aminovorans]SHJ12071.1 aminodeoxychorismate synthase, subunit I [Dethiosulfatibacter aminovorans DSM 17477]
MLSNVKTTYFESSLSSYEIYRAVEKGDDYILLDSSKKDSKYSRFSIMGANPFLSVKYENGIVFEKDYRLGEKEWREVEVDSIFNHLNRLLKKHKVKNGTDLPFVGGGLGYFGYELSKELENIPESAESIVDVPDCYFVFYDNAVLHDIRSNMVHITALGILQDENESMLELENRIWEYSPGRSLPVWNETEKPVFSSPFSRSEYMEAVESMRKYIEDGHIYIANMTHTFTSFYDRSPEDTYERLRHINSAPFSAYMPLDGFHILSSSPERFLEIRNKKVQTRPIKGTIPRGRNPEEDEENRIKLKNSEKDKSELLMIVDLERNDLSRVCVPGTVKVTELFELEEYATVFHLVSTVEGMLKDDCSSVDCIEAAFPGGSITGAPKIRAMEIIEELEKTSRNIYTGSIGYLGFDGNADFNIIIRTVLLKDERAYIGVGGGITWESDPEMEYVETLDKARALFKALDADYVEDRCKSDQSLYKAHGGRCSCGNQ